MNYSCSRRLCDCCLYVDLLTAVGLCAACIALDNHPIIFLICYAFAYVLQIFNFKKSVYLRYQSQVSGHEDQVKSLISVGQASLKSSSQVMAFKLVVGFILWYCDVSVCYSYVITGSLQTLWPIALLKRAKKKKKVSYDANKVTSTGFVYTVFPSASKSAWNHQRLHETTLSQYWARSGLLIYWLFIRIAPQDWAIFAPSPTKISWKSHLTCAHSSRCAEQPAQFAGSKS